MIRPHLRYASYVVRHKWFVFVAGLQTRAPLWRLIIHDWSKLTPAEWFPYVQTFYGRPIEYYREAARRNVWMTGPRGHAWRDGGAFDRAWLHHQHRNPHHWQHWLLREDDGDTKALRMPEKLIREMVADWMGAGRAITGRWDVLGWYGEASQKMVLHPDTRTRVEELLGYAKSHEYAAASSSTQSPSHAPEAPTDAAPSAPIRPSDPAGGETARFTTEEPS